MIRKLFSILSLGAAFAAGTFAQSNQTSSPVAQKLQEADSIEELFRPRLAAVKSSVVVNIAEVERIAFALINEKRVAAGQEPLVWNDKLEQTAREHSQNMAEYQFFSHKGLDNKLVSDRADDNGVGSWRAIGENIAFNRGFSDPTTKTVELWLESPSHRRNMLSPDWKESAIGVAVADDGSYYFTQVFLVRK